MKKTSKLIFLIISMLLVYNASNYFLNTPSNPDYPIKKISANLQYKPKRSVEYVYIVLVDGLRYDSVYKNMNYIKGLVNEHKACMFKARFEGPSYSRPGYARIFTGVPTVKNGIYSNYQEERCTITNLFNIARNNGLSTGASAFYWVGQLFNKRVVMDSIYNDKNENIQYSFFYSSDEEPDSEIFNNGMHIIDKYKPNLFLMHLMECDIAGHRSGGVSAHYSQCVENTDKFIEQFLSKIEMKNSIVMIISDHGHTDRGGHGERSSREVEVPVILIGDLIKGGLYDKLLCHEDIAPTVCMLLGLPVTPYMEGNPVDLVFK